MSGPPLPSSPWGLVPKTSPVPQLACHQLLRAHLPECKMGPTGTAKICAVLPGGQALLKGLPSIGSLVLVVATSGGKCVCCLHVTGPWGQVCETVAGRCSEQCLASRQPSVDPGSHLKRQCWGTKSQPVEPNVWGAGSVSQQLLSTYCMPGLELELATGLLGHRAQSCWLRLPCPLCCLVGAQGPGQEQRTARPEAVGQCGGRCTCQGLSGDGLISVCPRVVFM